MNKSIAFFYSSYYPANGGVANAAKNFAEALVSNGDDVSVYTLIPFRSKLKKKEKINGVVVNRIKIISILFNLLSFGRQSLTLKLMAYYVAIVIKYRKERYDYIFGHTIYLGGTFAHIISKINNSTSIAMAHGEDVNQLRGNKFKEKLTISALINLDFVFSTNTDFNDILREYVQRKIHLLPNIFISSDELNESLIFRRYNGGNLNLLCIGRFDVFGENKIEIKGFSNVLKAMISLPKNITLEIIGTGILKEDYESFIRENNLEERVKLLGSLSFAETQDKLTNCSLVLLPSNIEGLSMVMLETMSKGLPLLASKVGGAKDYIIDNENGFLIEKGNVEQIINHLSKIPLSFEHYKRISVNSKRTYLDNFSPNAVTKLFYEYLN